MKKTLAMAALLVIAGTAGAQELDQQSRFGDYNNVSVVDARDFVVWHPQQAAQPGSSDQAQGVEIRDSGQTVVLGGWRDDSGNAESGTKLFSHTDEQRN